MSFKKVLAGTFLSFFLLTSVVFAQQLGERGNLVEHLTYFTKGSPPLTRVYVFTPVDPAAWEFFRSSPLIRIPVPASPKSDELFFEFSSRASMWWGNYADLSVDLSVRIGVVSDLIPAGMTVSFGHVVLFKEYKNMPIGTSQGEMFNRGGTKCRLSRFTRDEMLVYYSDHTEVPDEIALPLLRALMSEGFDLEIAVAGTSQGADKISLDHFAMDITRLSKHALY